MKYHSSYEPSWVVGAAFVFLLCVVLSTAPTLTQSLETSQENDARAPVDVVVFGATPAGVTAAVAAARAASVCGSLNRAPKSAAW